MITNIMVFTSGLLCGIGICVSIWSFSTTNKSQTKPELESGGTGIPPRPFKTHDDNYSRIE